MTHRRSKSDRDRLADIRDALEKIHARASQGRVTFDENDLLPGWIVFQLLVIGEAASRVSLQLRDDHVEVPWRRIVDMRNTMIHGYSYIDYDIVWQVASDEVPVLLDQVRAILEELE